MNCCNKYTPKQRPPILINHCGISSFLPFSLYPTKTKSIAKPTKAYMI